MKSIVSLLGILVLLSTSSAQEWRIDFAATVNDNNRFTGVSVGDTISGQVRVDLNTLPPDSFVAEPRQGFYDYSSGEIPGFSIDFNIGLETISFDSTTAGDLHSFIDLVVGPPGHDVLTLQLSAAC